MDQSLPVTPDEAAAAWLDSSAMDSDDNMSSDALLGGPAIWTRADSSSSGRSTLLSQMTPNTQASTGPMSPMSAPIDIPSMGVEVDASPLTTSSSLSTVPTLDNLSSSPSPERMHALSTLPHMAVAGVCSEGRIDSDVAVHSPADHMDEMQWEISTSEDLTLPKIEQVDEDTFCFDDVQEAPFLPDTLDAQTPSTSKSKRPRGRPRKLSLVPPTPGGPKATKGRSKTGCITCRKRKKKCDEAKPRCMNCEKNAVVCEGYPEKQIWKSGKERAEEELLKNQSLPVITMQPIFIGLETAEDRIFWKHYNDHLSAVFTVEGEYRNAFRDLLVPLATRHPGMMHSILSLASRHLDYDTPYGEKLLRRTTKATVESLHERGTFHSSEAVKKLYEGMQNVEKACEDDDDDALAARYGQMLCLILESLAEGHTHGSQRPHYDAFMVLTQNAPPRDAKFHSFIAEIFYYHIYADDLVYYPCHPSNRLVQEDWILAVAIHRPRLIGVADGLFNHLAQVTTIRNRIRERIQCNADPRVDYDSLYRASDIEGMILNWKPEWPPGDSRERVSLLYKLMTWLYIKTTICPPASTFTSSIPRPVNGMGPFRSATTICATSSTVSINAVTISCASSPSPKLEALTPFDHGFNNPRRHSIANPNMTSGARPFLHQVEGFYGQPQTIANEPRSSSPPPIRRPSNHEPGVSVAVEESLSLLETFKPSDPAQALLLIPCVIVGTACYSPAQQERVKAAICAVHGYTGLRNTHRALQILSEVWRLMEVGDYLGAWDWQAVAKRLGVEHLF